MAGGLGVVIVVLIGWMALSSAGRPGRPTPAAPPPPPRSSSAGPTGTDQAQIVGLSNVRIEMLDSKQPDRRAGVLTFVDMDPLEGRTYAVASPEGLIWLRDGGAVRIRGAAGKLYMPDRAKEPESGTLSGGVTVELFAAPTRGVVDPATQTPMATFTTASVSFDTALGSISTSEAFRFESDQATLTATGLNVLMNRATQRLELAEIGSAGEIRVRPENRRSEEPAAVVEAGPAVPSAAVEVPVRVPVESQYRAEFREGVMVTESTRQLEAKTLSVWARLIDNRLAAGAIAPIRTARRAVVGVEKEPAARPVMLAGMATSDAAWWSGVSMAWAGADVPGAGVPRWELVGPARPMEIVMAWSGSCVIAPTTSAAELARDDVAMRFESGTGAAVRFSDETRAARGAADVIEYYASTRRLVLDSAADERTTLTLGSAGSAKARRIEAALGAGLVRFVGPATFMLDRGSAARASATEQTDVTLDLRDGALTGDVRQVALSGKVDARDERSSLAASFVRVDLSPAGDGRSGVSRLVAQGEVRAESGDSRLSAGEADVSFSPRAGGIAPRHLTARAGVEVSRGGQSLRARTLEASLVGGDGVPVDVSSVRAEGAVRVADAADGTSAAAERLAGAFDVSVARATRPQRIELWGQPAELGRTRGDERTTVRGAAIEVSAPGPMLRVVGAGEFEHVRLSRSQRLVATWTESLAFDDVAGTVAIDGGALLTAEGDERSRDRIEAGRLELVLGRDGAAENGRSLMSARALNSASGAGAGREGGMARLESRRYDGPIRAGGALERLLALDGGTIEVDVVAGTLRVPGAGRLLVRDARRRSEVAATQTARASMDSGGLSSGSRGDALFQWDGSMAYNRGTGEAELLRNVRLTHRRLQDEMLTAMRCDRATAVVVEQTDSAGPGAQLAAVRAFGSVEIVSAAEGAGGAAGAQREMVAEAAEYDSVRGVMRASGSAGQMVRFIDTATGSPVQAAGVVWDLVQDRLSIEQMSTVTMPR